MPEIEKGVPMPPQRGHHKYPFAQMEIGDSFLAPEGVNLGTIRSAAGQFGRKKEPRRYFSVCVVEGDRIRVWRTK